MPSLLTGRFNKEIKNDIIKRWDSRKNSEEITNAPKQQKQLIIKNGEEGI